MPDQYGNLHLLYLPHVSVSRGDDGRHMKVEAAERMVRDESTRFL